MGGVARHALPTNYADGPSDTSAPGNPSSTILGLRLDPRVLGPDIHVYSVPTMVRMIVDGIGSKHPANEAVPEHYPLLRALKFGAAFGIPGTRVAKSDVP